MRDLCECRIIESVRSASGHQFRGDGLNAWRRAGAKLDLFHLYIGFTPYSIEFSVVYLIFYTHLHVPCPYYDSLLEQFSTIARVVLHISLTLEFRVSGIIFRQGS